MMGVAARRGVALLLVLVFACHNWCNANAKTLLRTEDATAWTKAMAKEGYRRWRAQEKKEDEDEERRESRATQTQQKVESASLEEKAEERETEKEEEKRTEEKRTETSASFQTQSDEEIVREWERRCDAAFDKEEYLEDSKKEDKKCGSCAKNLGPVKVEDDPAKLGECDDDHPICVRSFDGDKFCKAIGYTGGSDWCKGKKGAQCIGIEPFAAYVATKEGEKKPPGIKYKDPDKEADDKLEWCGKIIPELGDDPATLIPPGKRGVGPSDPQDLGWLGAAKFFGCEGIPEPKVE